VGTGGIVAYGTGVPRLVEAREVPAGVASISGPGLAGPVAGAPLESAEGAAAGTSCGSGVGSGGGVLVGVGLGRGVEGASGSGVSPDRSRRS
jgi:hypothetical protein